LAIVDIRTHSFPFLLRSWYKHPLITLRFLRGKKKIIINVVYNSKNKEGLFCVWFFGGLCQHSSLASNKYLSLTLVDNTLHLFPFLPRNWYKHPLMRLKITSEATPAPYANIN